MGAEEQQKKLGMPGSIHHVSECEVDMGEGRGQPQNNALDHSFKALPQFWTPGVSLVEVTPLDR